MSYPAHAAPPLRDEFRPPSGRTCFINDGAARLNAARLSGATFLGAPTPAAPQVLVIRVDFDDAPMTADLPATEAFFSRVRAFYVENSYGVFLPTFTVTGNVHRIGSLATFGADCGSDIACNDPALRAAAITAENNAGRDFSSFDHVMIYHAGAGQETSGAANDIWSVFFPGGYVVDGKSFSGFMVVPEREAGGIDPLGVICHEYGHQIGLPDLYDTAVNGGASTVGAWDIMDYPYGAAPGGVLGDNPPHLGAWSKSFLGFLSPSLVAGVGSRSLSSSNVSSSTIRVPLSNADNPASEYLLIEYRRTSSTATFDRGLPGSGVLVWHIDDAIASSPARLSNNDVNTPSVSGAGHRGVDLIEADFTEFYTAGQRAGQKGDVFDAGRSLLPPFSNSFNGVPSGVALTSVADVGGDVASFHLEPPAGSSFTFSGATIVGAGGPSGSLTVEFSDGSLPGGTRVFVSSYTSTTLLALGSASSAGRLTPTGVGFVLGAERNRPSSGELPGRFSYAGLAPLAALTEDERTRLVLARYVPDRGVWVPLPSMADAATESVGVRLDRLSILQAMVLAPGGAPSEVRVFPNPLRPSLGLSYRSMNFVNVPGDARLRVFTADGQMIREIRASPAGHAVWDGRNEGGADAASGLYLVVIERPDGGSREVKKVAIER